jgi:hypothetical protein
VYSRTRDFVQRSINQKESKLISHTIAGFVSLIQSFLRRIKPNQTLRRNILRERAFLYMKILPSLRSNININLPLNLLLNLFLILSNILSQLHVFPLQALDYLKQLRLLRSQFHQLRLHSHHVLLHPRETLRDFITCHKNQTLFPYLRIIMMQHNV